LCARADASRSTRPGQHSTFFLVETLFVLQWGRLSDRIGRKPVVLVGLLGLTLSTLSVALSRTFLALVASRCLVGLLDGNIGVYRAILGEITDDTNVAAGFAFLPLFYSAGLSIRQVHSPGSDIDVSLTLSSLV
jgi:MFS family permease